MSKLAILDSLASGGRWTAEQMAQSHGCDGSYARRVLLKCHRQRLVQRVREPGWHTNRYSYWITEAGKQRLQYLTPVFD